MTKKEFDVTCCGLDDYFKGIVRIENNTYFVDDFLPLEKGRILTTYKYGKVDSVKLIKRDTSSIFRVKPICKYYPYCGGCQIQHLSYEKQLEYKKKKVKNLIKKFTSLDIKVEDTIKVENPLHFRNKIQMPIRKDKKNKIIIGYYKENTHDLIDIDNCLIEDKRASEIVKTIKLLLNKYHYSIYDEDKNYGLFRHLLLKLSSAYDEGLLTFVVTDLNIKGRKEFAKEIVSKLPIIKGVVFNLNNRHTNVILGEKEEVIYGYSHIKDKIFDLDFLISSKSFYQTNSKQIETLYKTAIDLACLNKNDVVLDAYCGTGTIGLTLARNVKEVTGVEIVKDAVIDARKNASINNINNATFINTDCTKYLTTCDKKYDVIFLDPPRKGSTVEFINSVFRIKPKKVVYISCDPVTLARDLNLFKKEYQIKKVIPVDMFPYSSHVETVCLLSKLHEAKHHVNVKLDMDELDITSV